MCVIIQRAMFTRSLTAGRWSLTFRNAEREVYKTELPLPMDLREAASKLTCVGQSEESSSYKICKMFGEDAVPLRNSRKRCHVAFHASICNRFLFVYVHGIMLVNALETSYRFLAKAHRTRPNANGQAMSALFMFSQDLHRPSHQAQALSNLCHGNPVWRMLLPCTLH